MKLNSDTPIALELRDPETRHHTVEAQIKIGIPYQIRAMREHREWTQETLAEKLGTTQNTISRLENPKTGKPTINTLSRLARVFDVGLLVRFVPFGFYGNVIDQMNPSHIEVPSYDEELLAEAKDLEAQEQVASKGISEGRENTTAGAEYPALNIQRDPRTEIHLVNRNNNSLPLPPVGTQGGVYFANREHLPRQSYGFRRRKFRRA